jgi:hypothetical protein
VKAKRSLWFRALLGGWRYRTRIFRTAILREAGGALLFFGVLAGQPELHEAGRAALAELAARGYRVPDAEQPARIFPALTGGDLSGRHAGGWRPGVVYLRPQPQGALAAAVYLRHELMHEASYRSCGGKLPRWAEEAAAMSFSGELRGMELTAAPSEEEVERLRAAVRQDAPLASGSLSALRGLAAREGWPEAPCAVSPALEKLLGAPFDQAGGLGYSLVSLLSGRVLESGGDQNARFPPGSLLKIPYAASLRDAPAQALGAELAASDTAALLRRKPAFDPVRYRLLLSPAKNATPDARGAVALPCLARESAGGHPAGPDERNWRACLGERGDEGRYPFAANLPELAAILRASLLSRPEYFAGLARNGETPKSTLAGQAPEDKAALRELRALAKTGTASDERGQPLVGHLLAAWPAEAPVYLALFRQRAVSGAAVLRRAAPLLRRWRAERPAQYGKVRVRLLSLAPRAQWEILDECPAFSAGDARVSLCGRFRIVSSVRGGRSERLVSGVLREPAAGGPAILETDGETYADAVLDAEARHLRGAAREALRAAIVWNGAHGAHRHGDTRSLCDTTHCMVFLGALPETKPSRASADPKLLALLDQLAAVKQMDWLPFATGGAEPWERRLSASEIGARTGETQVLDLRRERRKNGAIFIHLIYPEAEEALPCEIFRNALKLPACPDSVRPVENAWLFQGVGAGHGMGLSIDRAQALSEAGREAADILRDAYE